MNYQRGCESMIPPVARGALCLRCGKHPQAAVHKRLADALPPEQFGWCGRCRGNHALKLRTHARRAPRAPGQTHCACGVKLGSVYGSCTLCRRNPP